MEMKNQYQLFFGFEKQPFATDIAISQILKTPQLVGAKSRL